MLGLLLDVPTHTRRTQPLAHIARSTHIATRVQDVESCVISQDGWFTIQNSEMSRLDVNITSAFALAL